MDWSTLSPTRLDWLQLPAEPQTLNGPVDPYLVWADLTGFAGFSGVASATQKVPLAIQVRAVGGVAALIGSGLIESPAIYFGLKGRCFTGYAQRRNLAAIASHGAVKRLEMGLPLKSLVGRREILQTLPAPRTPLNPPLAEECVVGVIDFGCAFLNRAFWVGPCAAKTRLVAVWQQDRAAESPWQPPAGFGYGRELDTAQIDSLLAGMGEQVGQPAAEISTYQSLGYLYDGRGQPDYPPHGTFVLDTAAGRVDAMPVPASAKPLADDCASAAKLVFVDVPRPAPDDTSGAPLGVHIIDALHYIVDRAGAAKNIVINLSIGAQAGPHDGSSLVEEAIDELVQALRPERTLAVVISAGNGAKARCHAEGQIAPGYSAEFMWRLLPDDDTDNYLEIWPDSPQPDKISVEITSPTGSFSGPVGLGQARTFSVGDDMACAVLHCRKSAVGNGPMVLLAMAPTKATQRRPQFAQHGLWKVTIRNAAEAKSAAGFCAWVERDDPPVGVPVSKRQSLLSDIGPNKYVDGARGTINNIATGAEPVVVAACDLTTAKMTEYSGQPVRDGSKKRRRGADLMASADESPSAVGLVASDHLSGQRHRMGGTSVAAPVVARAIVQLLCCELAPKGRPPWDHNALVAALLLAADGSPSAKGPLPGASTEAPETRVARVTRLPH